MLSVSRGLIQALQFLYKGSDDQVILAPSACALKEIVNKINHSVKKSKSKAMVFERGESTTECDILIEGEKVEQVWVWQKKNESRVNAVEMQSLRSMCRVSRKDRRRNSDVRQRCGLKEDVMTRVERARGYHLRSDSNLTPIADKVETRTGGPGRAQPLGFGARSNLLGITTDGVRSPVIATPAPFNPRLSAGRRRSCLPRPPIITVLLLIEPGIAAELLRFRVCQSCAPSRPYGVALCSVFFVELDYVRTSEFMSTFTDRGTKSNEDESDSHKAMAHLKFTPRSECDDGPRDVA
ncbi:hypothetical protein EVAR_52658_1 [Eumeta japonica]|uniref:Uncharacterized protein n=1 Tax=Eumeta variegata TaxID=151549 RepID=A0A4C1YYJ5_EUMVA|nr:hypothetical protein EVAR_52658_1 [Eumeta japonica]